MVVPKWFNGQENDNEVKGEGNQQDYGFRIYDPRLGKFLSIDPLTTSYPWYTPYQFAGNKPINSIDLDGLEEYESYSAYAKAKGSSALATMDGSDGASLESDRTFRNDIWSNAMASITKNGWSDRLRDNAGGNPNKTSLQAEIGSAFGVVRDYYLWVQSQIDSHDFKSRWAQGAAYLVDEQAITYEDGVTSGAFFPRMGRLLRDLNFKIADYGVKRFGSVLYGNETVANNYLAWYKWDADFVRIEQGQRALPVYNDWDGTIGLDFLNDLSRKGGWFTVAVSNNYFPNFATFDNLTQDGAYLNDAKSGYAVFQRTNIPLFMLWPSTHATMSGIVLNQKQNAEIKKANNGIKSFYEKSKIKAK